MRKLSIAPVFIALIILLSLAAASAQVRQNPNRFQKRQQAMSGTGEADPQFGQRPNRPLGGQRRQNFPPFGGQPKPKPNQRQQLLRAKVMQALGLTPDQNARIRSIHVNHEDERIELGRRIRQARQGLDRAVMNDRFNEAEVRRATEELVAAQGDRIRLESRVRSEVRNVLTPDQVMRFHQLERELRREMKEQMRDQEQQIGPQGPVRPPSEQDELDLASLLLPVDDPLPN
jgi:Spy/CpxP family protein refolding chaperone